MHNLGGERNAQIFLKKMDEYVNSFRDGETVYYLSKEGRERIGCKKVAKRLTTARHYIMRNYLYMACVNPNTWKVEQALKHDKTRVICDATYYDKDYRYIVEVDNEQRMYKNEQKIKKYRYLIENLNFGLPVKMVWITLTPKRRERLLKLSEGLDVTVFLLSDFK